MKRMLINATHPEELRVAVVDGQRLHDLDIESKSRQQKKSNIYKAKITRIEPSLEAAFVDYGSDRHGFLPFKEIAREYLKEAAFAKGGRPNVKDGLSEGTEIIVQIEKEERGNKGAALTTFISLAGRFLVLMPNNPRAGGVSRRIEGEDRANLRAAMNAVNVPEEMGTIVRTAGIGRTSEELQWDMDYQADIWNAIKQAADDKPAPFLIYQESNIIVRALRDNFRSDIGEILLDAPEVYGQAEEFITRYMPHNAKKLKLYQERIPLFTRYQIESQIESAFNREVQLPSGGAIVIDHTEALISIDINSARATKGSDIEETATNTNLEACDEVARQLRLRDIGGLIVIDFIDMLANKNQRKVENRLKDALKIDRARVQIGRISRFGLMEMSRQRLRPSLGESSQNVCPRCSGQGTVRGIESLSLSILRLMEEEAMKDNTDRVLVQTPVNVASYLVNEKRENIAEIESRTEVHLLIVPSPGLETPHFHLERIRSNDQAHESDGKKSYELSINLDEPYVPGESGKRETTAEEEPVVTRVVPDQPAPQPAAHANASEKSPAREAGVVTKIIGAFSTLFNSEARPETDNAPAETKEEKPNTQKRRAKSNKQGEKKSGQRRNNRGKKNNQSDDKTTGESTSKKESDSATNDDKPSRGRGRNRRSNNRNKSDNRNKNEAQAEAANDAEASSEEQQKDKSSEANTGNSNRRTQKQGSNYNRSRRAQNDNKDDSNNQDSDEVKPADEENTRNKRKGRGRSKQVPKTANANESTESQDTTANNTEATTNDATADSNSANTNSTTKVSSKQPSQLKSTVRSLAHKSTDDKPKADATDSKPESESKADANNAHKDGDDSVPEDTKANAQEKPRRRGRTRTSSNRRKTTDNDAAKNDSAAKDVAPEKNAKETNTTSAAAKGDVDNNSTTAEKPVQTDKTTESKKAKTATKKPASSVKTESKNVTGKSKEKQAAESGSSTSSSWGSPKSVNNAATDVQGDKVSKTKSAAATVDVKPESKADAKPETSESATSQKHNDTKTVKTETPQPEVKPEPVAKAKPADKKVKPIKEKTTTDSKPAAKAKVSDEPQTVEKPKEPEQKPAIPQMKTTAKAVSTALRSDPHKESSDS